MAYFVETVYIWIYFDIFIYTGKKAAEPVIDDIDELLDALEGPSKVNKCDILSLSKWAMDPVKTFVCVYKT